MTKTYLLLLTACLFSAIIRANDTALTTRTAIYTLDAAGPAISYTGIVKSSCLANLSFSATITDIDGVNTTAGTRPRIYYKRSFDGNTWNNNTSATDGWKYVEATNTTSPFNFVINYTLLNGGGGVSVGQTLQYFVVAQDLVATPNISINSGIFSAPPASVALTSAAFPIAGGINFYTIVNDLGNNLTIGAAGDFTTLTAVGGLFNAINNVGLSGNTTVQIIDPLVTENNLNSLFQLQNTGCSAGTVNLVIKPAAGVTATLTGSVSNNPLIKILSSNVTIDGSNNGTTSRNLTISNTNTTSPVVILFGSLSTVPINNCTLKNTICNNGAINTGTVVISDGSTGGAPGYFNNITIQNNSIQKGYIGLLSAAVATPGNGSLLVTGNDINSISPNQVALVGIYAEGLNGAVITNNNIGNFDVTAIGPRYGIWLYTGTSNTTVSGNTISGITGSGNFVSSGIFVQPAIAASNNNITGNTVSGISAAGNVSAYGINVPASASGGITIQKNKISNIKNTNAAGYGAHGIGLQSSLTAANITVANNFIYDVAGAGSGTTAAIRNGYPPGIWWRVQDLL